MAGLAAATVASFLIPTGAQQAWAADLSEKIQAQVEEAFEGAGKPAEGPARGVAERAEGDGTRTNLDAPAGQAALKISGDRGTRFSGTCAVGGEENALDGPIGRTYAYDLNGRKLDCEISNEGGGDLRIVFDADNAHSEQSLGSAGSVARLVYEEDGVFVTSSSSGSSGQTGAQRSSVVQVPRD